ncbi:PID domain-containing protein [Caerostris darwini]|uniref:PID domain-containing protein n=1 Tax=Caerostris darwini TaxID=1538125 RepID=A0AAV4VCD7_9ARAC|nr:PID domain-containing protein [Caerostris darwini]
MAFRGGKRKDVKKQSYYLWFLGAKESKGLRGEEYIRPVLRHLVDKERELEPMKVTLQVSNKGIKIIQNVPRKNNKGKTEQIKHFIPHHAITCVMQESKPNDDVVCCILLIYNPLTKCPVHVHAYRCDSVETASTLRSQLQILIDRPENQKKFREIENRLAAKGLLPSRCLNSDGRSTRTDGSDRTEDSSGGSSEREVGVRKEHIASLYDSLAAELRERLTNRNSCPILLPPKDYDTVSRRQGKLDGIDSRRSTNYNLVGLNKTPSPLIHQTSSGGGKSPSKNQDATSAKSSGGKSSNKSSSGIGSDEALSSAIQEVSSHPDFESKEIDPDTSSDDEEDWPDASALNDDDDDDEEEEVIPSYEWRRPPRYAPAPSGAPRDRRSRSSPDDEEDHRMSRVHRGVRGIVDKFERRAASPTPATQELHRTPVKMPSTPRRSENPMPESEHMKHFDVVYRRHSNPLEKKIQRESRPVSYPTAVIDPVSPRPTKSRPNLEPPGDHRTKYMDIMPRQNFVDRPPQDVLDDHIIPIQRYPANYDRYADRHSPSHIPGRDRDFRDSRPLSSSPVGVRQFRSPERQSSPHDMYSRQRQISATDIRQERAFPSRFVEPYPNARPTYHPPPNEERRRSGYFDLPVDPRDYRHSFVESPFRRLPLNTQY